MSAMNEDDRIATMAYVDGELPPADHAAFEARLAREPALASAVTRERTLRARLQSAYAPVLEEPVPAGLLDLLSIKDTTEKVVPLQPVPPPSAANDALLSIARKPFGPALQAVQQALHDMAAAPGDPIAIAQLQRASERLQQRLGDGVEHRENPAARLDVAANEAQPASTNDAHRAALPHARRWRWPEWGAMAASLVLGLVFGGRLLAPHAANGGDTLALNVANDGAITAQGHLRDALEQRVAGTDLDPNSNVAVGLTFRNHAQQYCRTFTLDNASSGIACRQADGWVVADLERATSVPASAVGAYRTAGSAFSPSLLQAIDAMRDGDTLDAAGETAAKAKGWKP